MDLQKQVIDQAFEGDACTTKIYGPVNVVPGHGPQNFCASVWHAGLAGIDPSASVTMLSQQ